LLGQPIYSLIVVVGGLILSSGLGSLASDALKIRSRFESRLPALAAFVIIAGYSFAILPVIHTFIASVLAVRVLAAFLMVAPPGVLMGFCFPIGLRWLKNLGEERNLPWMWATNGAAGTLGSFIAIVLSMDTSITICGLTGAGFYLLAAVAVPGARTRNDAAGSPVGADSMAGVAG
jgi:predicted membrane-bound spermidine synthase